MMEVAHTEGFTGHIVGDPFALATVSIAYVRLRYRSASKSWNIKKLTVEIYSLHGS